MVYSGSAWVTKSGSGSNGSSVNLLLNSNFAINQRNYLSAANLASGAYGFDRWKSNFTNTTLTFTANTQGQELTINSGGGIEQIIERGLVPAGTYTLSWTGTATARVYNTGATPPSYAASPVTFTADGLANVEVEFTASGGTRTVSYVQFNAGTNTTWALATPTLQSELAACQRYFQLYVSGNSFPVAMGTYFAGGDLRMAMNYPVTMRTAPALVVATGTNYYISIYNTTTDAFDSLRIYNASTNMMSVIADGASVSGTAGNGALINTNNASASIAFNSEL
jgi:hypothetical protein